MPPSPTQEPVAPIPETSLPLDLITLPPGFRINIYSDDVPNARAMSLADDGTVFVGSRSAGNVYALRDNDGNGHAEFVHVLASGLNSPNGVAYRDGALYVAEISRILRFDNVLDAVDAETQPQPVVVTDRYPSDSHHGWKYLRFGPDGRLYVPQGVPCNVCAESENYGYISRINPDGSDFEIVARGVRNSVGFDWHPETGDLWFTDNGRDWLGDDQPPDELNHVTRIGQDFGFPYCHGSDVVDPEFGYPGACSTDEHTAPVQNLGPHVAALGLRFYDGDAFPPEYINQPFIAERGSWNRTVPIGYRVTIVRLQDGQALSYVPFAEGWLQNGEAWGRLVDLLVLPDGSLLVSDDFAGAVYRISYTG
ncbi:MAG: PQQ-dependent sugar dehydrogenase [Chloroflexota bacterium]